MSQPTITVVALHYKKVGSPCLLRMKLIKGISIASNHGGTEYVSFMLISDQYDMFM
jgi:hypothetical protein